MDIQKINQGQFSVNVLLRGVVDDFAWACTGVYGPNDDGKRSALWELSRVCARWPWHGV